MTSRAIYLENGRPKATGSPTDVIDAYLSDVHH